MKKNLVFFHPFLFALYPVLFLYAHNLTEYKLVVLFIPTVLSLSFAGAVYLITQFIFKKIEIAALVTTTAVILALSYNRILGYLNDLTDKHFSPTAIELLVGGISLVVLGLVVYSARTHQKRLTTPNKILTLIGLVLVVLTLVPIISYELKTGKSFKKESSQTHTITTKKTAPNQPDIYYIIFDRYAGPKSTEQYHFDNSDIFDFLTDKGFYVASQSATNYPKTFLSFASSLNMEYVDYLTDQTHGGASSDETIVTPLIRNNKVIKFLKDHGYTYVQMGSWWTPTSKNPQADILFTSAKGGYPHMDEFTTGFLNTTIISPVLKHVLRDPLDVSSDPWNNNHRQKMFYEFNEFPEIIKVSGPKFVFAHILAPHDPFVVDKNCTPISETQVKEHDHVYNYLQQLQCTNTHMKTIVTQIQSQSKTPPIIIIQSDEGPFPMISEIDSKQSWSKATDEALQEKFPIINAYYFPHSSASAQLYPSISPVNSFRVLFNNYFGTSYQLLPDIHYVFKDQNHYYQFIDISHRLK